MLVPSIGCWGTPSTRLGLRDAGGVEDRGQHIDDVVELVARPRRDPLMPAGQCTIIPLRVPPKCEATCLVHWYGVSSASAQPTGECG